MGFSALHVAVQKKDMETVKLLLDAGADITGRIDLNQPIAAQGPFDVIIHKLSDVMGEAEHDSQSQQLLERFEGYTAGHPHTVLLDPLPAMRRLLDRFASYRIMEGLQTAIPGETHTSTLHTPLSLSSPLLSSLPLYLSTNLSLLSQVSGSAAPPTWRLARRS
ncbi:UNVERIFIED_CONTAM: hypothetical protein FKN15_056652 [Acipenser sinensis]